MDLSLLIGGEHRAAQDNATFERRNPLHEHVVTRAAAASVEDTRHAADAASQAFPAWSQTGPGERRAKLLAAADAMDARQDDFIARMVDETGATPGWAGFNVMVAANMLREAASLTTQVGGDVIPSNVPDSLAMGVRVPCGVVVGIAPWNAPIILGTRAIATPLAFGNTVILKASKQCPATHHLIGEVLVEAGLGDGIVNVVTNAPPQAAEVVEALIEHPAVRRINFTGSTNVGRIIAEKAARHLKPVLLELGGKAPFVVLEDADLDAAVEAAAFGAFFNQGQICMSTERLIVVDAVADAFVEKLARKAEGVIMQPTVVDGVTDAMRLYAEESFGPVVAMMRVQDEEDALRVAQRIESGICHINGPTVHDEPQMPFGGVKSSGYGRFGGKAGIEEFTELRWMTMQLGPRHYPI